MKYRQAINHPNRVLARVAENWVLNAIQNIAVSDTGIAQALERGLAKIAGDLEPIQASMARCRKALKENHERFDALTETTTNARGSLLYLLTEKAKGFKLEREMLKSEHRRLTELLSSLNEPFSGAEFQAALRNISGRRCCTMRLQMRWSW